VPIALRAMRAWDIRAAKRARSSEMEVGEGIGAGEGVGLGGERGVEEGDGDDFMPFVIVGLRI